MRCGGGRGRRPAGASPPTIAYVDGDDLLPRIADLADSGALQPFDADADLGDVGAYLTANAYLGCWGIVDALERGADIVITGRVTDAAVTCGPAAWHHGWQRDDWDALAGAVVAGHVIECSGQATGGNYSFFTEVPGMERVGFPWAEVGADGSSVIGKHDGTGGRVSVGTVTSQLLYEIGGPAYLGPDVTARFDSIRLDQVDTDRVRISGTVGEPPPPTLKVAMTNSVANRNTIAVALTGLDIDAKADVVSSAFWAACPHGPADFAAVDVRVIRTDQPDPASNEAATAQWRITVKDPDRTQGRPSVLQRLHRDGAGQHSRPLRTRGVGRRRRARTASTVRRWCRPTSCPPTCTSAEPRIRSTASLPPGPRPTVAPTAVATAPGGPTERLPLGSVVGARSGDKGGNANLGVFARSAEAYTWMRDTLTVDRPARPAARSGRTCRSTGTSSPTSGR